jgi:two-component system, NarL family, response regulator LiaR
MNVLRLLANGSRNREIASELYTSVSTIKGDIARILSKLGVDDRVEAAVYATKHGLI